MTIGLWDLPGPVDFLDRIAADLASGRSLAVCVPWTFDIDALGTALGRQLQRAADWHELDAVALNEADPDPAEALFVHLGARPEGAERRTPRLLAEQHDLSHSVAWIAGFHDLDEDGRERWRRFIEQYSRAVQGADNGQPLALVLPVSGSVAGGLPKDDVWFGRVWWWRVVDRLDMTIYVRRTSGLQDPVDVEQIVEFAGYDLGLADVLIQEGARDPEEFCAVASAYAEELKCDGIRGAVPESLAGEVPGALLDPWLDGIVDCLEPDQVYWHSSALAKAERNDQLMRRLWVAQIRGLMPRLDILRIRVIETARERGLYLGSIATGEVEFTEIVRALAATRRKGAVRDLLDLARRLRWTRNELAHLKPVPAASRDEITALARAAAL